MGAIGQMIPITGCWGRGTGDSDTMSHYDFGVKCQRGGMGDLRLGSVYWNGGYFEIRR